MIPGLFLVIITALALQVQLIMAWPALATLTGSFESQNFSLQMRCPQGIRHHPFKTECFVNVTKLQEQGCFYHSNYIHIVEKTKAGENYTTNCLINASNHTCLQSPLCPSCVAHGTQLVRIEFNVSHIQAQFGSLTSKCAAICPGEILESGSMCQIRFSWPALATFSGNFQSENFALQMRCPPIIQGLSFSTECLVNVTKLQEQECLLDSEHIYITEKTEGGDDYITNCLINPSNHTCLKSSLCPSCVAHDTQLVRIGFNFSPSQAKFGSLTNKCVAVCPNETMLESDSMCRIRYSWPALATFSGNFQSENFTLQMRCPPIIQGLSFSTECLVNVTKLQEQECLLDSEYIYIIEKTEGGDDYITNCLINPSNRTCLQSSLCPSCVAHDTQLVRIGFNFSPSHAKFGSLTNKCVAVCPNETMLESGSMCRIRYNSRT